MRPNSNKTPTQYLQTASIIMWTTDTFFYSSNGSWEPDWCNSLLGTEDGERSGVCMCVCVCVIYVVINQMYGKTASYIFTPSISFAIKNVPLKALYMRNPLQCINGAKFYFALKRDNIVCLCTLSEFLFPCRYILRSHLTDISLEKALKHTKHKSYSKPKHLVDRTSSSFIDFFRALQTLAWTFVQMLSVDLCYFYKKKQR